MDKKNITIIDRLSAGTEFHVQKNEDRIFLIFLDGNTDQDGDVKIVIDGEKAHIQILGIIVSSGKQKINLYTLQDHVNPESVSDLFIKSVLFGESRFNYKGLIKIEKNAQKSNAYQKNQNLLMSDQAWADSRPYLEIKANDVRCTHGATLGSLEGDQLYYLMTRGIDEKESKRMLIKGFFREVLERLEDEEIESELEDKISSKLNQLL